MKKFETLYDAMESLAAQLPPEYEATVMDQGRYGYIQISVPYVTPNPENKGLREKVQLGFQIDCPEDGAHYAEYQCFFVLGETGEDFWSLAEFEDRYLQRPECHHYQYELRGDDVLYNWEGHVEAIRRGVEVLAQPFCLPSPDEEDLTEVWWGVPDQSPFQTFVEGPVADLLQPLAFRKGSTREYEFYDPSERVGLFLRCPARGNPALISSPFSSHPAGSFAASCANPEQARQKSRVYKAMADKLELLLRVWPQYQEEWREAELEILQACLEEE